MMSSRSHSLSRFLLRLMACGCFGLRGVGSAAENVESKVSLKISLGKLRRGPHKLWEHPAWDRRPPFARNKSKSNRESPRGGGGSKVRRDDCAGPAALSLVDFFSARGIFSGSCERVGRNSLDISMAIVGRVGASSVFIFYRARAPGGRSKVWGLFIPDRWPRRTHLFVHFWNLFFRPGSVDRSEKIAAKFRVGGVAHG
jgi:hypothetical protein